MKKHSILWALAIIVGAGVLGMAGVSRAGHGQTPTAPAAPAVAPLGDLHVPAGFKVSVFASDLAGARMMTVSPEGMLLAKASSFESRTAE